MTQDEQHLQLLAIFHYVVAGFAALFSLVPVIHLVLGVAMVSGLLESDKQEPMASWFGWLFIMLGAAFILCGLTFAGSLPGRVDPSPGDAATRSAW